jgi:hypothetical protein
MEEDKNEILQTQKGVVGGGGGNVNERRGKLIYKGKEGKGDLEEI